MLEMDPKDELGVEAHVLLLGSGLRVAALRSVMTVMALVTGLRGRPFFVDKTLDEAAAKIAAALGRDGEGVVELLVAEGLVTLRALEGILGGWNVPGSACAAR